MMTFILFLSDMTENEKRHEGDYLMTCFVIHVNLLSLHIFLETAVLHKSLSFTTLESSTGDYHDEMNGVNFLSGSRRN